MHYKRPKPTEQIYQPKMFEILGVRPRRPIPPEDQRRLTLAVQKISNIFG